MKENRIKTSAILENQLPSFVQEEYPLFIEFLQTYYNSLEYQGGIIDILENIDEYVKIDNITNFVESTILVNDIVQFDKTLQVESTKGFPLKFGLVQIDDEIIFYKERDPVNNTFTKCVRGFSGRISEKGGKDDQLIFSETFSAIHKSGSVVKNLSVLFLKIFLQKSKKQFIPGFENRKFYPGVNEANFIKQSKDFYASKGTSDSFKILFRSLYGANVELTKPSEFLIEPSNADFRIDKILAVEVLEGKIEKLLNKTLYQDQYDFINKAYGTVNHIRKISNPTDNYYLISVDNDYLKDINLNEGTVFGDFSVHPSTRVVTTVPSPESLSTIPEVTIDVDSTVGFPDSGTLYVDFDLGRSVKINYKSKSLTQFFNCSGVFREIPSEQLIRLNTFAYGYGDDENEIIKLRVTGVLKEFDYPENNYLMSKDDTVQITNLGYSNESNFKANNWLFNLSTKHRTPRLRDLGNFNYEIVTHDPIKILNGDQVLIKAIIRTRSGSLENVDRIFDASTGTSPENSFKITNDSRIVFVYYVQRLIRKISGLDNNPDIQNVYVGENDDIYVASPSLPNYYNENLDLSDRKVYFDVNLYKDEVIPCAGHGFLTGDAVAYVSGGENNSLNIAEGIYFVKREDDDRIKLARSRSDIFSGRFISLTGNVEDNILCFVDDIKFETVSGENNIDVFSIKSQDLIRKFSTPIESIEKKITSPGPVGMFVNGVEILSYKSEDSIKYGPIEYLTVKSQGEDYDIINPPLVQIDDIVGVGASAHCHVSGSLSRIEIEDAGFDYVNEPVVTITGGNGKNASAKATLISLTHSVEFNAISQAGYVNLSTKEISFPTYHKFRNAEKVIYKTQGGVSIGGLVNNSIYYVSVVTTQKIKLHDTFDDALNGINPVSLTSYGSGNHIIESFNKKKQVGSIRVNDPGQGYANRKNYITSSNINLYSNIFTIQNHGYQSGEIVVYTKGSELIGGLGSSKSYYVTKIDENNFRISEIYEDTLNKDFNYKNQIYVNITSLGNGYFNYPPIEVKLTGSIGISSLQPTGVQTYFTFDSTIPNYIGVSTTANIKIGYVLSSVSGFIATNTTVTSIGIGSIGISTSHLYSSGISSTILRVNEYVDYTAKIIPVFRGQITSTPIISNGVGYGSSEIVNHDRQPRVFLLTGNSASATPIISNGSIKEVLIQNRGTGYNSQPNIEVVGDGFGAQLTAVLDNDGSISKIVVVTGGLGYNPNTTKILITNSGQGAKIEAKIKEWTINLYFRSLSTNKISQDGGFVKSGRNELQYYHFYPPKTFREKVFSKKSDGVNITYQSDYRNDVSGVPFHSPIIGWAYDGNPIYGPYGYKNPNGSAEIVQMKSGYILSRSAGRPTTFPLGYFIDDYVFTDAGNLDEFNGRYCKTPEFPNGTYAYFTTLTTSIIDNGFFQNQKSPVFPYIIGPKYRSLPDSFNYSPISNQKKFDVSNLLRNTLYYNLNSIKSEYLFLTDQNKAKNETSDIKSSTSGSVDGVEIISGGVDYNVGDKVSFDTVNTDGGYGASAEVSEIVGKNISKVSSKTTILNPVYVIPAKDNQNQYVFISENPHEFSDEQIIKIVGINTTLINFKDYYTIQKLENVLQLRVGVDTTYSTGIVTHFEVSGRFDEPYLLENDFFTIGNEVVKIIDIDKNNSRVKVIRNQNGQDGSYLSGQFLVENSRKFVVTDNVVQKNNYDFPRQYYFDPNISVGLGTTGNYSLFFGTIPYQSQVSIGTGTTTFLYFTNTAELSNYSGGYVQLTNSTNTSFNVEKSKILSIGSTSITIDKNTSALGIGTTGVFASVNKWNSIDIPTGSIYIPNHKFTDGQKVKYYSLVGSGITVSTGSSTFELKNGSEVYITKLSSNLIGISTIKVGLNTLGVYVGIETSGSLLKFVGFGTGTAHSFKAIESDNSLVTSIEQNLVTVETEENPELDILDKVFVSSIPNKSKSIKVVYNDQNRRLLIDPKTFLQSNVNVLNNTITIKNHNFKDREKVLYLSNSSGDLTNNSFYYVLVVDSSTIKLSTKFNKLKETVVKFNSQFSGQLSKVNPQIFGVVGETLKFDLSDSSLSYFTGSISRPAFKFEFFSNSELTSKFASSKDSGNFEVSGIGTIGISSDASVQLKVSKELPEFLWYTLSPVLDLELSSIKKEIIIDDENNPNYNRIVKKYSSFYGENVVVGVSTTSFSYTVKEIPENEIYYNKDDGEFNYTTTSKVAKGTISKIKINFGGKNYKSLPTILKINSEQGKNCLVYPTTKSIGKIIKIKSNQSGYDYPSDRSLRPQAKLPQILKLTPLSSFVSIQILDSGKNYSIAPNLIVKDGFTNTLIRDVALEYSLNDRFVSIVRNTKSLYDVPPTIIPVNNSNGIKIKDILFNFDTKYVTVILDPDYSSIDDFPFEVGDNILIEGVSSTTDFGFVNRTYNSEAYNFDLFKVIEVDPNIGGANGSVTFSMEDLLKDNESPGTFDVVNSIGKILPEKYFPVFKSILKKNEFFKGETIYTNNKNGIVEFWDKNNQYLKVSSKYHFLKNEIITGESSNSKASITNVTSFDGSYKINSSTIVESGWQKDTGFLNNDLQRIADNDYYQYLSYALRSIVPFNVWDESVSSLSHPAGFKKFSDLIVESKDRISSGIETSQNFGDFGAITDLDSFVSLHCVDDFDLASEESVKINERNISEQIILNGKTIQDYQKSVGNKVLVIDDLSPQFNSEPSVIKYDVVNTIRLNEVRFRKYIMCIQDRRFSSEKEILLITLLQNDFDGYLNQYGRVETVGDLGYFDFNISGDQGNLLFYPNKFDINDYNTSFLSFDLTDDNDEGILDIGSSMRIRSESMNISSGIAATTVFSIPSTYKAAKVILQYSRDDDSYEVDEISLVHDGTNVEILEYGQLIDIPRGNPSSSPGFGTYFAYIDGSDVKIDFIPSSQNNISVKTLSIDVSSTSTGIASTSVNTGEINSNYTNISASPTPTETIVASFSNQNAGGYYFALVEDLTNTKSQVCELVICSNGAVSNIAEFAIISTGDSSLGTFTSDSDGSTTTLKFTPLSDIEVNVRIFQTLVKIPTTYYNLTSIDI